LNVDHEWWDYIYEDAENVFLKITSFDDYDCEAEFIGSAMQTADKILEDHGEDTETHETATTFLKDWAELVKKYAEPDNPNKVAEDNDYESDQEADDLEEDLLRALQEDYRIMLRKEYEYLTSEEAVIETIEADGYGFTEKGELA
jgi:hypothetical protein